MSRRGEVGTIRIPGHCEALRVRLERNHRNGWRDVVLLEPYAGFPAGAAVTVAAPSAFTANPTGAAA